MVEIRRLPVVPDGHGVSRRRADIAPTIAGRTTVWHGSTLSECRKVTVEPRYALGASRWTPNQLRKPYLNHGCILKIHLRVSFTQMYYSQ